MSAGWLRHPPREVRRPACPHGRPFASRWLALAAIPSGCPTDLTPTACSCGGWHLTPTTPEENP